MSENFDFEKINENSRSTPKTMSHNYMINIPNESERAFVDKLLTDGLEIEKILFLKNFFNITMGDQVYEFLSFDENNLYPHPYIHDPILNCAICYGCQEKHKTFSPLEGLKAIQLYEEICKTEDKYNFKVFECQVCFLPSSVNSETEFNGKRHEICKFCFLSYLKSQIFNGKSLDIICPHCSEKIEEETLQSSLEPNSFEKYLKIKENAKVIKDPLLRWCPNQHCGKIIKLSNITDSTIKCEFCDKKMCLKCNKAFHDKVTCESMMNRELKSWSVGKDIKKCPHCKAIIQKIEGCNHITCSFCNHNWCWLCEGQYTSIHFLPFNPFGCPGLQSNRHKANKWNCLLLYIWRIVCLILIVLAFPFVLIFAGPIMFYEKAKRWEFFRKSFRSRNFCCCLCSWMLMLLMMIIMEPFFIAAFILGIVPGVLYLVGSYALEVISMRRKIKILK